MRRSNCTRTPIGLRRWSHCFFHLPEPAQFAHAQMGVLPFPRIEGGVTHPELPAEITDRGAAFGLTDRVNDLFLGEFDRS